MTNCVALPDARADAVPTEDQVMFNKKHCCCQITI